MRRSGQMGKYKSILKVFCFGAFLFSNGAFAADDLAKTRLYRLKSYYACNNCDLSGADLRGTMLHQSN